VPETLPAVAFLGTGLMGRPMCARLLAAGYPVRAWNRTRERAEPLATAGARVVATPAEAVRGAEAVVLMLADAGAIRGTLLAPEALAALAGATVIQMGTIGPAESREIADAVRAGGGRYLEAPVLGSVPQATAGELIVMAGGEAELYDRWRPLLAHLGRPRLVGPVGHAAVLKLAMNQLIAGLTASYALGLALVRRAGVDVDAYVETVRASALHAPTFDRKLPNMLARRFTPANFPARHLLKDVRLALGVADELGVETAALDGIARILERTLEMGLGDADYSALAAAIEQGT